MPDQMEVVDRCGSFCTCLWCEREDIRRSIKRCRRTSLRRRIPRNNLGAFIRPHPPRARPLDRRSRGLCRDLPTAFAWRDLGRRERRSEAGGEPMQRHSQHHGARAPTPLEPPGALGTRSPRGVAHADERARDLPRPSRMRPLSAAEQETPPWCRSETSPSLSTPFTPHATGRPARWRLATCPPSRARTKRARTSVTSQFGKHRLSEISRPRGRPLQGRQRARGPHRPAQINKTLKRLSQILELAVDYGYLPRNPAASRGGRWRLKESKPQTDLGRA